LVEKFEMRILFRCLYSDRSPDIQVSHMLVNKRLTSMLSRPGRGGPLSSGGETGGIRFKKFENHWFRL